MRGVVLLVWLALAVGAQAQDVTGKVSGKVQDASGIFLTGAGIAAYQHSETPVAATSADQAGKYTLVLAPGRYRLVATFTGFQSRESELLVTAGKSNSVSFILAEIPTELSEVVVSPDPVTGTGLTSVSIEKTLRVPANFFDPVRMLTSYPGVVAANDQANSIIVKGYSPNHVLWRLEGLDIINPNHLANAGTMGDKPTANGGGTSILSAQVLERTDFRSGYLPAGYGNGLAGIMDMKLRAGSADKMQYTAQASLIGMDVAAEGPLNKARGSSFLVNYRYSTVGLLSNMGVDFGGESINFQDLTFHVNTPHKNGGELSVFGFAGNSKNVFKAKPEEEWEEEKDRNNITFNGLTYGMGLVNRFKPGTTWAFVTGLSYSGQQQERNASSIAVPYPHVERESYQADNYILSGFVKATRKLGAYGNLETGLRANHYQQYFKTETIAQAYADIFTPYVKGNVNGLLLQPYTSWTKYFGTWQLNAGLQYVRFGFNDTDSWEPKLSVSKNGKRNTVTLSAGTTSQIQQAQNYLAAGRGLDFTRSHQALAEWKAQLPGRLKLTTSAFYHWITDAPVIRNASYYSTLNQWDGFVWNDTLVNRGKGRNYGLEASLEKRFYNDLYFIVSGSRYEAKFYNGVSYLNSRFNTKFTTSLLAGKEWNKENRSFGVHVRALYLGGLRQPAIDLVSSQQNGTTLYQEQAGYSSLPDYFRSDLRVSWRKNKPGYTRTISVDVQNVTSQQNTAFTYFDTFLQKEQTKYQLGIIPVLAYRIDF